MAFQYNRAAPKKAANLSVNSDLLAQARKLELNLSATFERALVDALRQARQSRWLAANREAIEAYNEMTERHGVFSDGWREF